MIRLLLRQFGSPIALLLIGAACLSVLLHDATDAAIILAIVVVSGLLGSGRNTAVLNACSHTEGDGEVVPIERTRQAIGDLQARLEAGGCRTLGVALHEMRSGTTAIQRLDETRMTFLGILLPHDPPKAGADQAVAWLARLGVTTFEPQVVIRTSSVFVIASPL